MINGREFAVSEDPVQVLDSRRLRRTSYMQARRGAITLFSDVGRLPLLDRRGGGMYETNRWNFGNNYGGETDTWLEMLAGGRYWHQELDVDVALAGTVNLDGLVVSGARATARSGVVEWIDPFLGLRMHYKPTLSDEFTVRGDIGGFGIGSQFTWHVLATYNSYLGTHAGIAYDGYLGYKALSVDYDEGIGTGRYEFDVIQQGPVVGITGRF